MASSRACRFCATLRSAAATRFMCSSIVLLQTFQVGVVQQHVVGAEAVPLLPAHLPHALAARVFGLPQNGLGRGEFLAGVGQLFLKGLLDVAALGEDGLEAKMEHPGECLKCAKVPKMPKIENLKEIEVIILKILSNLSVCKLTEQRLQLRAALGK